MQCALGACWWRAGLKLGWRPESQDATGHGSSVVGGLRKTLLFVDWAGPSVLPTCLSLSLSLSPFPRAPRR